MNPQQHQPPPGQPPIVPPGQPPYNLPPSMGPATPPPSYNPPSTPNPYNLPPSIGPAQPSLGATPPPMQPLQPLVPLSPNAPPPDNNNNSAGAARSQVADSIKNAVNVLVTVSNNPSVDQLAAAIGLTLVLNKLNKHGTAVFSGEVPSTIEFLQPEQTLEKNTDSLRDFIIALDKAKADKLRYKLEDKFVKIFITPYHTSLSEDDLEFSQGDFNVDVVVALGVKQKDELDQAITAHGRILHDASVVSINDTPGGELGTINMTDTKASSLSEIVVGLLDEINGASKAFDGQIATAFLTGIVAETERFSNDKTTSLTMNTAAKLMSAGANQQLIATKLEEPKPIPQDDGQAVAPATPSDTAAGPPKPIQSKDGSLQIEHDEEDDENTKTLADIEEEVAGEDGEDAVDKIHIDEEGTLRRAADPDQEMLPEPPKPPTPSRIVTQPPVLGGALSANTKRESVDPSVDPLTPQVAPLPTPALEHSKAQAVDPNHKFDDETLSEIEQDVASPHAQQNAAPLPSPLSPLVPPATEAPLQPIAALNAQPVDLDLGHNDQKLPTPDNAPQYPSQLVPPVNQLPPDSTAGSPTPSAPPPVPPPFMPPTDNQLPPPAPQ